MLFCAVLWLHCSFFSTPPASPEIYALSLHDALPIYRARARRGDTRLGGGGAGTQLLRDRTFERSRDGARHGRRATRALERARGRRGCGVRPRARRPRRIGRCLSRLLPRSVAEDGPSPSAALRRRSRATARTDTRAGGYRARRFRPARAGRRNLNAMRRRRPRARFGRGATPASDDRVRATVRAGRDGLRAFPSTANEQSGFRRPTVTWPTLA